MVVGARRTGLSVSETADLLGCWSSDSSETVGENAMLMPEVRREWPYWLEIIERLQ